LVKTDYRFPSAAALETAVRNLAEYVDRPLDARHHSLEARLPEPERFRVHAIASPASRQGMCVSIRKFRDDVRTFDSWVARGSLTEEAADYLRAAVRAHRNIIVSGGTGAGKTSLLNTLSSAVDEAERAIVIEDASELRLAQPHVLYLEARPAGPDGHGQVTIRDLFVDSLRMRPDRIIVGEVRRGEALDLVQSMLSGHDGSLSTVHASSPRLALVRLETLCLMSGVDMPVYVARQQVASAIHLIVQIARVEEGRRAVVAIATVAGLDREQRYRFRTVFHRRDGQLVRAAKRSDRIPPTPGDP